MLIQERPGCWDVVLVWRFVVEVEVEVKLFDGSEATHVTVHARLARFRCGCLS